MQGLGHLSTLETEILVWLASWNLKKELDPSALEGKKQLSHTSCTRNYNIKAARECIS